MSRHNGFSVTPVAGRWAGGHLPFGEVRAWSSRVASTPQSSHRQPWTRAGAVSSIPCPGGRLPEMSRTDNSTGTGADLWSPGAGNMTAPDPEFPRMIEMFWNSVVMVAQCCHEEHMGGNTLCSLRVPGPRKWCPGLLPGSCGVAGPWGRNLAPGLLRLGPQPWGTHLCPRGWELVTAVSLAPQGWSGLRCRQTGFVAGSPGWRCGLCVALAWRPQRATGKTELSIRDCGLWGLGARDARRGV